ncbi:ubiquinol-cytochrome c reductase iron-sulfur subunit [Carboxylicivirga sp. N1Y90]|uniref:QcrA and Rieske domain-containing protein n=1 Tax=Carboxylicivirga fragile TaxID=3417571 RepID=UPI003D338BC4|nr:ubiquinol-cytochrome c reductase iron-sulfur subunit [Marinilabiliaceae bacterium N1Y90]
MVFKKIKFNRRTFIKRAIYAALSIEVLYVFTRLLNKNNQSDKENGLYDAGNINFFENDKVYPFSKGHFYLSRFKDGGLLAISTKCTHLGCTIQFNNNKDKFVCPCHASAFTKNGEVLSPPATRALDIYPITIIDNKVMVNTSKAIRRNKYDASQLTYV